MPKQNVEEQLEHLNRLRHSPPGEETATALRKALRDRVNVVVSRAAKIGAELQLQALVPDLQAAFERLFRDPVKTDPQCWGKNAIAKALKDLGCTGSGPFLRGVRHVQLEPVWGGQEDTAAVLRGTCALALVQCNDMPRAGIFRELLPVVAERSATARADAARAVEQMQGEEAVLLLRLKALLGDADARVTGQVLESVLSLEGESGVEFVARFLEDQPEDVM
jgi:hypothetical protein